MHCLQSHTIREFFSLSVAHFRKALLMRKSHIYPPPKPRWNKNISLEKSTAAADVREICFMSCITTNWRIQRCLFLKCFLLRLSGGFMVGRGFSFPENCPQQLLLSHFCFGKQKFGCVLIFLYWFAWWVSCNWICDGGDKKTVVCLEGLVEIARGGGGCWWCWWKSQLSNIRSVVWWCCSGELRGFSNR